MRILQVGDLAKEVEEQTSAMHAEAEAKKAQATDQTVEEKKEEEKEEKPKVG